MNRAPYVLGAALLAAASTVLLGAPGAAAESYGGGFTCGMSTSNTPGEPRRQSGSVTGGPWTVDGGERVALRCTVRIRYPVEQPVTVFTAEVPPGGGTAVLGPTPVAFSPPQQPGVVEVCSAVTVYADGQPPRTHEYDADGDPSNGVQCVVATPSVLPGGPTIYVVLARPDGETCFRVRRSPDPTPLYSACVPALPSTLPPP